MKANEYQKLAARTMKPRRGLTVDLSDYVMGLCGEAGELANKVKKMLFHNHEWNTQEIMEEVGDIAWYAAAILEVVGISMEDALTYNIEKLKRRYPNGYSDERSRNRTA